MMKNMVDQLIEYDALDQGIYKITGLTLYELYNQLLEGYTLTKPEFMSLKELEVFNNGL